MLTWLNKTRQRYGGRHQSVDALLDARHTLLVQFVGLLDARKSRRKCLPACQHIQDFCSDLMDYVTAGHFEIYQQVVDAIEAASGRQQSVVNRILPRIQSTTEFVLDFNDKYGGEQIDEEQWLQLDEDLNQLGPMLEKRFRLEDRLVRALQIMDEIMSD